jgi:hypothetical protein
MITFAAISLACSLYWCRARYRPDHIDPPIPATAHSPSSLLALYDAKHASSSETQPLLAESITGEKAQELLLCTICNIKTKSIAIGCGHLVCDACITNITKCPICSKEVSSLRKIYF